MARAIFKEELALFTSGGNGITFQPNPNSMIQNEGVDHLQYFKFVGRFVAKALMDCQILDAYFTRPLYKHLLGEPLSYEDIEAVDPDYFKNLKWMLCNDIEGVFDLTFTAEADYFDKKSVVELKPGGAEIAVTNENKQEYVDLMAHWLFKERYEPAMSSLVEGFSAHISISKYMKLFTLDEIQLLLGGRPDIDLRDLQKDCKHTGGYHADSAQVQWLWSLLEEYDSEKLSLFLGFVSGCASMPVDGLDPPLMVTQMEDQESPALEDQALPRAHTCFNQLDLPEYATYNQLLEKLKFAFTEASSGFGFV